MQVSDWYRRVHEGSASPWPSGGPYDLIALRLPRAKDELRLSLAAVAGVAAPNARLLVYGANDEGIKSVAKRLGPHFTDVSSAAVGGHCRVLAATATPSGPASRLDDWLEYFDPGVPELSTRWVSIPGVFAHGTLDEATRLLIDTLPIDLDEATVLDYGAGTGPIAGVCAARGAQVDLLEPDAIALHAARQNVPTGRPVLADSLVAVAERSYDWIVSNPPIHRGKAESHEALEALISGAPERLSDGGTLRLVVQRRVAIETSMESSFGSVRRVADHPVFKVVEGRRSR